jgi:hypothetical protein
MTKDEAVAHYERLALDVFQMGTEVPTGAPNEVEDHRARLAAAKATADAFKARLDAGEFDDHTSD